MMETPTRFASAERASPKRVRMQASAVEEHTLLREVLATVPHIVVVLNQERQVVFANQALTSLLGDDAQDAVGRRPGEILGCVNSQNRTGGCGTSEACRACGVVNSILAAAGGEDDEREARLSLESGVSLDLKVVTHPITVDGEALTVLTLTDIAHEKRRRVLERVFFHDVLNTAGGVQGLAGLIKDSDDDQMGMLTDMLEMSAAQLVDEIQTQRLLTSVEDDRYEPTLDWHAVPGILDEVVGTYLPLGRAASVGLEVAGTPPHLDLETDRTMLGRVLGNLVKNAIEASQAGMTVLVGALTDADSVEFWVHNRRSIPPDAKLQIFQRSFSTKGAGRGLGTYSVRLFAEQYLGGGVSFDSSEGGGTTFRVKLPLKSDRGGSQG